MHQALIRATSTCLISFGCLKLALHHHAQLHQVPHERSPSHTVWGAFPRRPGNMSYERLIRKAREGLGVHTAAAPQPSKHTALEFVRPGVQKRCKNHCREKPNWAKASFIKRQSQLYIAASTCADMEQS